MLEGVLNRDKKGGGILKSTEKSNLVKYIVNYYFWLFTSIQFVTDNAARDKI